MLRLPGREAAVGSEDAVVGVVRIGLCGEMVVTVEGRPCGEALRRRQGRLLLAMLALHRGRTVTRDELIDALWGEQLPGDPGQALSVLVSKLRRALEADVIESMEGRGLRLTSRARVDVEDVEDALDDACAALECSDARRAAGSASRAAEIAGRGLLPGLEASWLEEPRRELAELALRARETVAAAGLLAGGRELVSAERVARALVDDDPFRESAYALLMRILAAQGNVAAALLVYERLRRHLGEELGVAPGKQLKDLHTQLLQGAEEPAPRISPSVDDAGAPDRGARPSREPAAPRQPAGNAARIRTAFVGRRAELKRLGDLAGEVAVGRTHLVLVAGDAGIGKTRLAIQFADVCREDGATVLYGRCDAETLVPYQPFIEALRAHLVSVSPTELGLRIGVHISELARVLPELAPYAEQPERGVAGDPQSERYMLFDAVSAMLGDVASGGFALLVLDDLHWADKPTLLMLRQVVRLAAERPLMILGTYRETDSGEALRDTIADLHREQLFERIRIAGLDEADTATLVGELRGAANADLAHVLWGETHGNPFFLEEMLRHLSTTSADHTGDAPDRWAFADVSVPEAIKDVVNRRLAQRSAQLHQVLRIACVIGGEFSLALLERLCDLPEDALDDALAEAVDAHIIEEAPGAYGRYAFAHSLIRQTLYDNLTRAQRARLHLRVGTALEQLSCGDPAPPLAELARHFAIAPPAAGRDKAIEYAQRAAGAALDVFAYEPAARHYEIALTLLEPDDDREQCLRVRLSLGEALVKAGEGRRARETFANAAQLARALGDPSRLARAALGYGASTQMAGGVVDRGLVALLEEALGALGEDPILRSRLLARLAMELSFSERGKECELISEQAVALAHKTHDPGALAFALIARHWALWGPHNVNQRLAAATQLLRLAQAGNDRRNAIHGHRWRMINLLELGDIPAVDAEFAAYTALAEERRQPLELWYVHLFRALRLLLAGRFDDAEIATQRAQLEGERIGDINATQGCTLQLVALRREQGRLAEIEPAVRENVANYPAIPGWRCVLAHVCAQLGATEEARCILEQFAREDYTRLPRDAIWVGAISYLGEVATRLHDATHTARLYDLLLPYADRNIVIGWASTCAGSAARLLGMLAALTDRRDQAAQHFEQALAINHAMGAEPWVVRTQLPYAELLLANDDEADQARAHTLLHEGLATATRLGMTLAARQLA